MGLTISNNTNDWVVVSPDCFPSLFLICMACHIGFRELLILNTMEERQLNPPDTYTKDKEEIELTKCACCLEPVEDVFQLGLSTWNLVTSDMVCEYCLNQMHQNLTLKN